MKKGFTLVELIAVIALLSILIAFVGISVTKINQSSREELKSSKINYILTGARDYGSENINKISKTCKPYNNQDDELVNKYTNDNYKCLAVGIFNPLVSEGFIVGDSENVNTTITDPLNDEDMDEEYDVCIIYVIDENRIDAELISQKECSGKSCGCSD